MKAAFIVEPGKVEVRDIAKTLLAGEDHVLVHVKACTICATDMKIFHGRQTWRGRWNTRWGHEITGIVDEAGRNVSTVQPGQRVLCRISSEGFGEYANVPGTHVAILPAACKRSRRPRVAMPLW